MKKKGNAKKAVLTLLVVFVITAIFSTVVLVKYGSAEQNTATTIEGYKVITDVPGVEFQVKKEFSDYSTAVNEITKNSELENYITYSYKDGSNIYLLFNINRFIVVAKKGTNFNFQDIGVQESLSKNSINGIWFNIKDEKDILANTEQKCVLNVEAQVVITNQIYNDFKGTLTTVTHDNEEWTVFAGYTDNAEDTYIEAMQCSSSSVVPVAVSENNINLDNYYIDDGGRLVSVEKEETNEPLEPSVQPVESEPESEIEIESETLSAEETHESSEESSDFEINIEETQFDESSSAESETLTEESAEISTETSEVESESSEESETDNIEESMDLEESEEYSEESIESTEENTEEPEDITEEPSESIEDVPSQEEVSFTNENNYERKEDRVYTSSIYNMLKEGDTGLFTTDINRKSVSDCYVKLVEVYNATETEKLIEDYIQSGESYYTTMEAPQGTHFEAVRFHVNFLDNNSTYVDVRFCGMDGESLKYRGIEYSMRTYEITNQIGERDGWSTDRIVFYTVPNGCKEYVIKVGDGTPDTPLYFAAYYQIKASKGSGKTNSIP